MAKKQLLTLDYTKQELATLLNNADKNPIYIHYDADGSKAVYRIFSVGDDEAKDYRCNKWLEARNNDSMTDEIYAYQIGYFDAPAPYSLSLSFTSNENVYVREGDTGNVIKYTFMTTNYSGSTNINESVQVVYNFNNAGNVLNATKIYNAGEEVNFNIDKYLTVGTNTITITATGRSTGASTIYILHYYVVAMDLSTTFNVAVPLSPNGYLLVPYSLTCSSSGVKYIEFYIDGVLAHSESTSEIQVDSSVELTMPASGKHHLLILAHVTAGDGDFYSKTLYREFVVTGQTGIHVTVAIDLDANTLINTEKTNLFLTAEQYVLTNIIWGYYNSTGASGTVRWTLDGQSIRATDAQVTDAESNAKPYVLSFVPTTSGTLNLTAKVNGVDTAYLLVVHVNSSGVQEATQGLALKLMSLGRSNDEPSDERNVWEWNNIKALFPAGWAWSEQQGWVSDDNNNTALAISGGKLVTIPYAPLANAPHTNGAVFEIDFETYDVDDEDAVVCSVWGTDENANEVGIKITAEGAIFQCNDGSVLRTLFKLNERIKLAFVINRISSNTFPHLAFLMVDGVYERALDYKDSGRYTIGSNITLGNAQGKAGIKVYGIRCYTQALTVQQELQNAWIDSGSIAQSIIENDIYANGIVSVEKMQGVIPVMLFDGLDTAYNNITTLENVKDKNTKINVNVSFYNPNDPTKNFTIEGARMKLQGTSSLGYPRKNFKLYSKKDSAVMRDFEGSIITKGLYAFLAGDVPVNTWTLKADFMDSSCTRNASVARIFGDIEPNLNVKNADGDDALKTPPQIIADKYENTTGIKFPYKLRTTPNGLAMVCFHKLPGDSQYTFLGQYTMLNDKGNDYVYGFHSIYAPTASGINSGSGLAVLDDPMCMIMKDSVKDDLVDRGYIQRLFDNKDVHCYEILDNVNELSNFNTITGWEDSITVDDSNFKHCGWEAGFESRYPEIDDGDYTTQAERTAAGLAAGAPLKAFIQWMMSCKSGDAFDMTKFENEMEYHLDLHFCAAYYIYLMRFGAVDQVKKNMMWTTYGKRSSISAGTSTYDNLIWMPIRYDNDSTVDKRNDGTLFYNYKFTRSDLDPSLQGAYYYSGHDSLLWNALEQSTKFKELVKEIDNAFYAAGLTYQLVLHYYDELARDQWCESIYNENQKYKYIDPILRAGDNKADYLAFLQGRDKSHQHWWFRNRFDTYDAEWGTGEFANKYIHILTPNLPVGAKIGIVPCKNTYFGLTINKTTMPVGDNGAMTKYIEDGQTGYLVNNYGTLAIGDPIYINGANNIEELDLSELAKYITTYLEFDRIYDSELGSNMKKLVVGLTDLQLENGELNVSTIDTMTGLNVMTRLEYLDMKGLSMVTDFAFLKNMSSLKTLLLKKTGMTSFTCADGASFTKLQLPDTLRSINVSRVNWTNLDYTPNTTLTNVTLNYMNDDSTFGNVKQFVFDWLDALEDTYGMDVRWTNFSLNLTGVNWSNVPYHRIELLMNLGTCIMNGHSIVKCATAYTNDLMLNMMNAFGDTIFTAGSDLIFDCDSPTVVISTTGSNITVDSEGVIEILQGTSCVLKAVGFPIETPSDETHEWMAYINREFAHGSPYVYLGNLDCTLHKDTGEVVVAEKTTESPEFIIVYRSSYTNESGFHISEGRQTIRFKPRTYPTEVTLDLKQEYASVVKTGNVYNIQQIGNYLFKATNKNTVNSTFEGDCYISDNIISGKKLFSYCDYIINSDVLKDSDGIIIFPVGLMKLGTVYDSASGHSATRKINRVEMSLLNWKVVGTSYPNRYYALLTSGKYNSGVTKMDGDYVMKSWGEHSNRITGDKLACTENYAGSLSIFLQDDSINDIELLKTKLTGKYIYYELTTPVEYLLLNSVDVPYTGTQKATNGGVWTLENGDSNFVTGYLNGELNWNEYVMAISNMPDEINMRLNYTSNWNGGVSITATPLEICLISTIMGVLVNNEELGNVPLFKAVEQYGVEHSNEISYDSLELKDVVGTFDIGAMLEAAGFQRTYIEDFINDNSITAYNVLKFLKNVETLIIDGCDSIEELNVTEMPWLINASMEDTHASFVASAENTELRSVKLGTPSAVNIKSTALLSSGDVTIQDNSELTSIDLLDLENGTTFDLLLKLI